MQTHFCHCSCNTTCSTAFTLMQYYIIYIYIFFRVFSCTCIIMLISSFALFPVIFPYIQVYQRKSKMKLMFRLPPFYLLLFCATQALGKHAQHKVTSLTGLLLSYFSLTTLVHMRPSHKPSTSFPFSFLRCYDRLCPRIQQ